jgi:hypothetical protein
MNSAAVDQLCNGARYDYRIASNMGILRYVGGEYISLLKAHNCYWYSIEVMALIMEACMSPETRQQLQDKDDARLGVMTNSKFNAAQTSDTPNRSTI